MCAPERAHVVIASRRRSNPRGRYSFWIASSLRNSAPHDARRLRQRLELAEGDLARQVLHAAIGRRDQVRGRHVGKARADALRDRLGALHVEVAEVEHAEQDRLAGKLPQHAEIELRLRGLDRDLLRVAAASSGRNE